MAPRIHKLRHISYRHGASVDQQRNTSLFPPFPIAMACRENYGGYVVRDANDQALADIYSRENTADARRFNELTSGEARRIAEFSQGRRRLRQDI